MFKIGTRLGVQRAGKILMNLMRGAAERARTGNLETLLLIIIQEKIAAA